MPTNFDFLHKLSGVHVYTHVLCSRTPPASSNCSIEGGEFRVL